MRRVIGAVEELARIRNAFGRVFLNHARGESDTMSRIFEQPGELRLSELTLVHFPEEEGAPFADGHVAFPLAAATNRGAINRTRALIEGAGIRPAETVLDVAGGAGEPSLTIAEVVGPEGSVTCTDGVAQMVEAAHAEAQRRGLTNMQFQQCAADSLPFPKTAFGKPS